MTEVVTGKSHPPNPSPTPPTPERSPTPPASGTPRRIET